jgi:hypothetical protein
MKNRAVIVVVAVAVLIVAALIVWRMRRPTISNEIDLVTQFDQAEKRPAAESFGVLNVSMDGRERRSILARPSSRLIYTITVPRDAWFETSFGMRPESWDKPGDGAQFRIGVSEGRTYEELLRQYVNPKRGDRQWFTARLDLSAYEGRTVKVILNTDPGPPGDSDATNDEAVWGAPRVFSQR